MAAPASDLPHPFDRTVAGGVDALLRGGAIVLTAAPGSGKTTRLPPLLQRGLAARGDGREIWVLEPRRVAATMAARFVAASLGQPVGETVGYQVRFDSRRGPQTTILFLTYGMFLRRAATPGALERVATILFDEFHERSWQQDTALAASLAFRQAAGDSIGLGVLSATLDAQGLLALLAPALHVDVPGRAFPVAIDYAPVPRERPWVAHAAGAIRTLMLASERGDLLAFASGPAEIHALCRALVPTLPPTVDVLPLYGRQDDAAQARALTPAAAGRRKVIVSTNIAESSLTIDGVSMVVDGGTALLASDDAVSGVAHLARASISQASATQRAGRAGRQGPGRCLRLYSAADARRRPQQEAPEVLRLDLTELLASLASMNLAAEDLSWPEPLPKERVAQAKEVLQMLGAIDAHGRQTEAGRRMGALGLHPRLARVALVAQEAGASRREVASWLALLDDPPAARNDRHGPPPAIVDSDVDEALRGRRADPAFRGRLQQFERLLAKGGWHGGDTGPGHGERLERALLAGFADRVARRLGDDDRRGEQAPKLALVGGRSGRLDAQSGVRRAKFLLALAGQADRSRREFVVSLAHAIEPSMLLDAYAPWLSEDESTTLTAKGRVQRASRVAYGGLTLFEELKPEPDAGRRAALLAPAALDAWQRQPAWGERRDALLARLAFVGRHGKQPAAVLAEAEARLTEALAGAAHALALGAQSVAELSQEAVWQAALQSLPEPVRAALSSLAPTRVTLAGGKQLSIHWQAHAPPFVESYLQDFIGQTEALPVGRTNEPLTVHLWAPNRRPIQVTRDLKSFWQTQYPALRGQLSRRYPRHRWP